MVGIVVDQMRYDFLYRYWDKYGTDGFRRLLREGYNCRNTHYNYTPTYTGPGHASIYTGTTPAVHGIVGNDWFVCEEEVGTYCTTDKGVTSVGNQSVAGQMSPRLLLTTTITDELRLATNQQSKVIGVALKDRGAILPAGHLANAAYWFDGLDGNWITSSYYTAALPGWVNEFNGQKLAEKYLSQTWNTLLPLSRYTESTADDVPWESPFAGQQKPVFPYELAKLRGADYNLIRTTPWGNTLTKDFAVAAIKGEQLGQGSQTDFLCLSFSSTDYLGHQFGPNSIEVEDTYLRLDRDIAELLQFLDRQLGKDNVLLFLTADHGAAHAPEYLKSMKTPAGSLRISAPADSIRAFLNRTYGKQKWMLAYDNQQVYLNRALMARHKLPLAEVQQRVADFALSLKGVARTVTAHNLHTTYWASGPFSFVQRGHYPRRSGDVYLVLEPGYFEAYSERLLTQGTTHGTHAPYDTHVPLLWYGWRIAQGEAADYVQITDIAPTVAQLLHIQEPNGCTGTPILKLLQPLPGRK